jgi:hypothetical protein
MKLAARTFVLAVAVAALAATLAVADHHEEKAAKSSGGDVLEQLKAHEMKIWDAIKAKDGKLMLSLIDPNAWTIDPMGLTPAKDFVAMLPDLDVRKIEGKDYRSTMLSKDVALLTFTMTMDGSFKGEAAPPGPWYVSTIYAKRGKAWVPVFHQETLGMPAGAAATGHEGHGH